MANWGGAATGAGAGALAGASLGPWGALGGGAIGGLLGLFGGDEEDEESSGEWSGGTGIWQDPNLLRINEAAADWITKYLPGVEPGLPYSGSFTSPMTSYETKGMDWLNKYLTEDTSSPTSLTGAASKNVFGTLTDQFDPYNSNYYNAFRTATQLENTEAKNQLRRDLAARNKYFSSEAMNAEADLGAKTASNLNQFMAQMGENERSRQMQAVPLAMQLALEPVRRAEAATTLGSIPRLIANLDLDKRYADFVRQQEEKMQVANIAAGIPSAARTMQNPTYVGSGSQGSFWGNTLGTLANVGTENVVNNLPEIANKTSGGLSAISNFFKGLF